MKRQPIKRSEELKLLSREHHSGLLFSWKIKEGMKLNIAPARFNAYLNYFWENHLKDHFSIEEILLFNKLPNDPICKQAIAEHVALKNEINILNTTAKDDIEGYKHFIELLNNHIRFEERTVFPLIESKLPASELHEISLALEKHHTNEFKDEFADEFWIKEK